MKDIIFLTIISIAVIFVFVKMKYRRNMPILQKLKIIFITFFGIILPAFLLYFFIFYINR